jgi:hypothetical protein
LTTLFGAYLTLLGWLNGGGKASMKTTWNLPHRGGIWCNKEKEVLPLPLLASQ